MSIIHTEKGVVSRSVSLSKVLMLHLVLHLNYYLFVVLFALFLMQYTKSYILLEPLFNALLYTCTLYGQKFT